MRLKRQLVMQKVEISTRGRKIKTENYEGMSQEVEALRCLNHSKLVINKNIMIMLKKTMITKTV